MLNLFKKKKKETKSQEKIQITPSLEKRDTILYAPAAGQLISIEKVNDSVFSKKLLGDGYAVIPTNGEIVSPVDGKIVSIFPTKHAFGILTEEGDEIILHIGIDTVELNGTPFDVYVKEEDVVHAGMKLANMKMEKLNGKDPTTIVVFANIENISTIMLEEKELVLKGEVIGKVSYK